MSKPLFQHRHYKAIAAILADAATADQHSREAAIVLLGRFATMFANDNPRFDRARFIAAANGAAVNVKDERV